jgi:hypothetical protein
MAVRLWASRSGRPLPPGRYLVHISVRSWVDPRANYATSCPLHSCGARFKPQLSWLRPPEPLGQRCTSRAQRTVCDYLCCCAVHTCTGWPGPACSWWGEGRIGNWRGRWTDSKWERQMICLQRYGGGYRFDTSSSHACTMHCTRAGILCTSALGKWRDSISVSSPRLPPISASVPHTLIIQPFNTM